MRTRLKLIGVLGVSAISTLSLALAAPPAFAWPASYEGQPAQLQPGGDAGFYVWHDAEGNHLVTTGPGPEHHFQATISTDGQFMKVGGGTLEAQDNFDLSPDGHTINVDLTSFNRLDRIRWRDQNGTNMTFQLMMDGQPIDQQHVYVGAAGQHPLDSRFCLFQ